MSSPKILDRVIEKWPVKILSLAVAIIISVFYRMNNLETRSFSIPLGIEINDSFVLTNSFEDTVRVSLRGEAQGIHPILEEDIYAFIDLNRFAAEGSYRAPVQIRKKGNALGVEPLEISVLPIEVPVVLEQKIRRSIPVHPVFQGIIAENYELASQSVVPQSITAEGPRSAIESQYSFITETIDLNGRYENFEILINIINNNPLVSIHGSRMIEYSGTIRPIAREERRVQTQIHEPEQDHYQEIEDGENGQ